MEHNKHNTGVTGTPSRKAEGPTLNDWPTHHVTVANYRRQLPRSLCSAIAGGEKKATFQFMLPQLYVTLKSPLPDSSQLIHFKTQRQYDSPPGAEITLDLSLSLIPTHHSRTQMTFITAEDKHSIFIPIVQIYLSVINIDHIFHFHLLIKLFALISTG